MRTVEELYAGDVTEGDDLANMGEVVNVYGGEDAVLIEWRGPFSRLIGTSTTRGATFSVFDKLFRLLPEED